jgi:hypothetical protein
VYWDGNFTPNSYPISAKYCAGEGQRASSALDDATPSPVQSRAATDRVGYSILAAPAGSNAALAGGSSSYLWPVAVRCSLC